jgi:uncharacterized protein YfaP (DUF2135 family)
MKLRLPPPLLIASITCLGLLTACFKSSNSPGAEDRPLTAAEKQVITASWDSIATSADSLLTSDSPREAISTLLQRYRGMSGVDSAWLTEQALFVKFTRGGVISWNFGSRVVIPPYMGNMEEAAFKQGGVSAAQERVGSGKACLLNQQYYDEERGYNQAVLGLLSNSFQANGYSVTVRNGSGVSLDYLGTGLSNCAAVFFVSHGEDDGTHTWIATGEEGTWPDLLTTHLAAWTRGEIGLGTVQETRGEEKVAVSYYTVSEKFFEKSYATGSLPHSLIYLVACQGLKSARIATSLISRGAAAVVGWNETNCKGPSTGHLLFNALLGGKNLEQAIAALPDEGRTDDCAVEEGAELVYYPPAGKTLELVRDTTVVRFSITSPTPGSSSEDRVATLSGSIPAIHSITTGIVEVNGIATVLESSGRAFNQSIELVSGANTIKIIATGRFSSGRTVHVDTTFTVTGEFTPPKLWTELRWNTDSSDVDLHLLPPDKTIEDLWSFDDCSYRNLSTDWGCELDIDDVEGYGPEHITIPETPEPGVYRLFVHYYDAHGAGTTSASVSVSVNGGIVRHFGPYSLSQYGGIEKGDLWEVCRITYPSGQITPINQLTRLGQGALKGVARIPKTIARRP